MRVWNIVHFNWQNKMKEVNKRLFVLFPCYHKNKIETVVPRSLVCVVLFKYIGLGKVESGVLYIWYKTG